MFKALGRIGSHVRALNIPVISNLFGKSRPYGGLDDDDTDNFVDAKEELHSETESELELEVAVLESNGITAASVEASVQVAETYSNQNKKQHENIEDTESNSSGKVDEIIVNESKDSRRPEDDDDSSSDSDYDYDDDDEHCHKDTKVILKANNELGKSASTSTFQRVHRRINSYTQRQYAKLDSIDGVSDHEPVITSTPDPDCDTDSSTVFHNIEDVKNSGLAKKPKRRKKVAKRVRRAVRGSWKWFRRGMLQYAHTFNTSFYVVDVVGAAVKKTY